MRIAARRVRLTVRRRLSTLIAGDVETAHV
jgi:hypothetical protein